MSYDIRLVDPVTKEPLHTKVNHAVLDIGVHFNHPIETALYEITYVQSGWGSKDEFVVFGVKEVSE